MAKDPDIKKPKLSDSVVQDTEADKVKKSTEKDSKKSKKSAKKLTPNNFKQRLEKLGIKRKPNKKVLIGILSAVIIVIIVVITTFGVMIYKYKKNNKAVAIAARIIPYPITSVNGSVLWNNATYNDYLFELASVEKFYKSQDEDLTTEEGKVRLAELKTEIIKQLQDRILIAQQARKYKIKLTQKEVNEKYTELEKNAGGPDKVKETLEKLYGWSVADFKKQLSYKLLEAKLAEAVSNDPKLNEAAKAQAEDVKKQLDAGGDFAELAKKYSADSSATQGGDLGFFKKGDNVAEFDDAAFALPVVQVSGAVKTQYGYHIIKVTDKKDDQIRASHILIKSVDLDGWLQETRTKAKIRQYFTP